MLKKSILICLLTSPLWVIAQSSEDQDQQLQKQIEMLDQKVQTVEQIFNSQLRNLKTEINSLTDENQAFKTSLQQKQITVDSVSKVVEQQSKYIQATADSLGIKLQDTDKAISQNTDSLQSKTIWGVFAVLLTLLVSVIVALLLHKKGLKTSDDKIASLKKQSDELNEKIVGQFSSEMGELQKIGEVLKAAGEETSAEPDHSLVKTLADRITFMEMTLYRMDSSVKGHKQLSKSIAQMKDNLLANGYEIVDMLGKEYDEGMKVTANFVEDENIEAGKQIITSIVKPQINYKGVMIQSAQITVSQN